ncbi:hypothetical protein DL768_001097 [Monosporascus sp. mg162]|nr:hypothetical protein DL768_001097 [Monosporascus sp. mg162]
MPGPASPNDGPTFAPPQLPSGWIAQWDGNSKKYYFVQLSTGVSQWDIPTQAAPGGTPAQAAEHPYGVPGQQELITHPDGTQTVKYADGRMEPILPEDASRAVNGPTGDRGFGSLASNALLGHLSGGGNKPHGGSHGNSNGSSGLGGLANQLMGGLGGGSHGGSHGSSHGSSSGGHGPGNPGKLVGQLASSIFSSSHNKPDQAQSYHSGQSHQPQHSGGLAGTVMGGVANMFGHGRQSNYGYSNSSQSSGYSGQAPPTSYQTPSPQGTPSFPPPPNQSAVPSYPPPPGHQGHHQDPYSSPPPSQQHQGSQYGGVPPPPPGQPLGYGHSPAPQGHYQSQHQYGSQPSHQPSYGGPQQYPPPPSTYSPSYGNVPPPPGGQHAYPGPPPYGNGGPSVPTGPQPHHSQHGGHQGGYPGNW